MEAKASLYYLGESKVLDGANQKVSNADGKIDGAERASLLADPTELTAIAEDDPWALSACEKSVDKPWSELSRAQKAKKVVLGVSRPLILILLLYIFVCSLDILTAAFRLLGGKLAGNTFRENALLTNPVTGLMLGILATLLVQSSSTSTSIIVAMVASGILTVQVGIPVIMGANIGTSITNTLVSLAQSGDRNMFRRAFGGATVHDMFNWLTVLILLPLEVASGYLYHLTKAIVRAFKLETNKDANRDFLKTITKPITDRIIQLNETVYTEISIGNTCYDSTSLVKEWCSYKTVNRTFSSNNDTCMPTMSNGTMQVGDKECEQKDFLFNLSTGMSDAAIGATLLVLSLAMLIACLLGIVKTLSAMMHGQVAAVIRRTVNADFPGKLGFLTGYVTIIVGAILTIIIQSSSVFTSTLTPLVGLGLISIERVYPLTLGSNVGTTFTSMLAALAAPKDKLHLAVQISLCHLFFNISGILLFYPVPILRRLPIRLAKALGDITANYRWFAIVYLILMFVVMPTTVFALSVAGIVPLFVVVGVIAALVAAITVINVLQQRRPACLPEKLLSWDFLPLWMRSLKPLDSQIQKVTSAIKTTCLCPKMRRQSLIDSNASSSTCSPFGSDKLTAYNAGSNAGGLQDTYSQTCFHSSDSQVPLFNSQTKEPLV